LQSASDVFHEEHKVQVVGGARLELGNEVEVEVACIARFGMDEQASTSDVRRKLEQSSNDVLEKADAESLTFMVGVDTESCEECDGFGITSGTFAETPRCRIGTDLGHAPGVVSDNLDTALFGCNEDTSRSSACRLAGITLQPFGLPR
jgi:hypothetical protein